MVESAHTAGFWTSLYEPFRGLGGRIAGWFAPASEAGTDPEGYGCRRQRKLLTRRWSCATKVGSTG